jgi:hypothetical protein
MFGMVFNPGFPFVGPIRSTSALSKLNCGVGRLWHDSPSREITSRRLVPLRTYPNFWR